MQGAVKRAAFAALACIWSSLSALAGDCDVLEDLTRYEARHMVLMQKLEPESERPARLRRKVGPKLASTLASGQVEWEKVLDHVARSGRNGYDEAAVRAQVRALEAELARVDQAIEIFAKPEIELGAVDPEKFSGAPGARAQAQGELNRIERVYEDWSVTGKLNSGELARIETRIEALSYLASLGRRVRYENPGAHDRSLAGRGARARESGTSRLPLDHEALWSRAVPDSGDPEKVWWSYDGQDWHRFIGQTEPGGRDLVFHWNGSTRASDPPNLRIQERQVPKAVQESLKESLEPPLPPTSSASKDGAAATRAIERAQRAHPANREIAGAFARFSAEGGPEAEKPVLDALRAKGMGGEELAAVREILARPGARDTTRANLDRILTELDKAEEELKSCAVK